MTILEQIVARRKERLVEDQERLPLAEIRARLADLPDRPRDFARALRGERVRVIAEFKRASPSEGMINVLADPRFVAQDYAAAGAAAISVLTEPDYFAGESFHLRRARSWMPLPVLRKDFLVDEYQLYESRLLRADAVLLIVRALSEGQLRAYLHLARELGMEALVETHDEHELAVALATGAQVVGINNRNLDTLHTSLQTTLDLAPGVPPERLVVSESGLHTAQDVETVAEAGVDAILVGTALMRADEPDRALRPLTRTPRRERGAGV